MVDRDINKDKLRKQFGKVLRESRIEKGWTIEGAARESNLDDKNLGRIENGRRGPSLATLYKLRKGVNISVDEIFDRISEEQILDDHEEE